jgi:hypothetical protein
MNLAVSLRTLNVAVVMGAAILLLAGCSDDPTPLADEPAPTAGNGVCLATAQIDHTEIVSDTAILFFMKGGKTWVNTMSIPCSSLKMEDGFAYINDVPEICSNSQTIRVLRSGGFCELGQFAPFEVPKIPGVPAPDAK